MLVNLFANSESVDLFVIEHVCLSPAGVGVFSADFRKRDLYCDKGFSL